MTSGVVYLVRHGRTAWNRGRFLGRADVPLDAEGAAQAKALAAAFAGLPLDAVVSSPLARARATAVPIAAVRGLVVVVNADLAELDCGEWEGILKEGHAKLSHRDPDDPFPGGESLAAAMERVRRALGAVLAAHADGAHVAIVGHQVVNRLALGALRGLDVRDAVRAAGYHPGPGSALAVRLAEGMVAETYEVA